MADSPHTPTLPDDEAPDLIGAGDLLADAKHFVLCAQMAVANFGPSDDRVSAIQSATMAALDKIEEVAEIIRDVRQQARDLAEEEGQ